MLRHKGKPCDPSLGREEALKYIKRVIRDNMDCDEVLMDRFMTTFMEEKQSICFAFQQLVFNEIGSSKLHSDIEQSLSRFNGLFATTEPQSEEQYRNSASTCTTLRAPDLIPIDQIINERLETLLSTLYLYLSRNSNRKESLLKALKLLYKRYAEELKWMTCLEKRCRKLFGKRDKVNSEEFHRMVNYQKDFSDRMFMKFDRANAGYLSAHELYDGLVTFLTNNTAGRLKYLFEIYDTDDSGCLGKEEVDAVLKMSICESKVNFREDLVSELSRVMWGKITNWQKDSITFDEFYSTLQTFPSVYNNLNINIIGKCDFEQDFRFLKIKDKPEPVFSVCMKQFSVMGARFTSNKTLFWFLGLYIVISLALLSERLYSLLPRPLSEAAYVTAKCAGQLLNFNTAFTLLLVLKHITTKLRKLVIFKHVFPFDDMHFLHKMVAVMIIILSLTHAIAHAANIVIALKSHPGISPTYYLEGNMKCLFWSGIVLCPLLTIFVISALPKVRAFSYEFFMRTHQITTFVYFICMLVHAKNFWKWILLPVVLLVGERLVFSILIFMNRTKLAAGIVHGNITQLIVKMPKYFKYNPGDYVLINIPVISKGEWHPFTISSSPDPDCFTLHIRKVGSWTGRLHSKVTEANGKKMYDANIQPPPYAVITTETELDSYDGRKNPCSTGNSFKACTKKETYDGSKVRNGADETSDKLACPPYHMCTKRHSGDSTAIESSLDLLPLPDTDLLDELSEPLSMGHMNEQKVQHNKEIETLNSLATNESVECKSNIEMSHDEVRMALSTASTKVCQNSGTNSELHQIDETNTNNNGNNGEHDLQDMFVTTDVFGNGIKNMSDQEKAINNNNNKTACNCDAEQVSAPDSGHKNKNNGISFNEALWESGTSAEFKEELRLDNDSNQLNAAKIMGDKQSGCYVKEISTLNYDLKKTIEPFPQVPREKQVLSLKPSSSSDGCQRIYSRQISADMILTPLEKRILRSSYSSMIEEQGISPSEFQRQRSISELSRYSSRTSIVTIPVEDRAALGWRVYVDGPYSTPACSILSAKHAILVAGGIGITPFASILESIINILRYRKNGEKSQCYCSKKCTEKLCKNQSPLRRIDFFWVTRDQSQLSWFHQMFQEIELAQADLGINPPLVNLHIYLTELQKSQDIRGAFLQLALEMIYQEDNLDVLSGLKAKTKPGRPVWSEVLKEVTAADCDRKIKPKLFACGPSNLCDELKIECRKLDIVYKEEIF